MKQTTVKNGHAATGTIFPFSDVSRQGCGHSLNVLRFCLFPCVKNLFPVVPGGQDPTGRLPGVGGRLCWFPAARTGIGVRLPGNSSGVQ